VQANVRARPLASFVADAQQAVAAQVHLPPGYAISWGGSFQNLQEGMARLSTVVPVALAVIFLLLYLMFGSARLATLIFFNVVISRRRRYQIGLSRVIRIVRPTVPTSRHSTTVLPRFSSRLRSAACSTTRSLNRNASRLYFVEDGMGKNSYNDRTKTATKAHSSS
jgi:hypothetical protein